MIEFNTSDERLPDGETITVAVSMLCFVIDCLHCAQISIV